MAVTLIPPGADRPWGARLRLSSEPLPFSLGTILYRFSWAYVHFSPFPIISGHLSSCFTSLFSVAASVFKGIVD